MRQADLAEALGVSEATVINLERGKSKWTDDYLAKFCEALSINLAELLRLAAEALEGGEVQEARPVDDPLRAKLNDLYDRKDWTGLLRHLGDLADHWNGRA